MSTRKTLEERLTELGEAVPRDPAFAHAVMRRIAQPEKTLLAWPDRLRLWMNHNSAVATVLVVALLTSSTAFLFRHNRHALDAPPQAFFLDTATGIIFTDAATRIPPILSPAGNPAVRAHVFGCGGCDEPSRFTGYYERYTEEMKWKLEETPAAARLHGLWIEGREYSADGQAWVPAGSPEGLKMFQSVQEKCPAQKLRYCPPE